MRQTLGVTFLGGGVSLQPKGQGQKVYTRPQGSPVQKLPRPWGGSSLAIAKPEKKLRLCSRPTTGRLSIVCRRRKNFYQLLFSVQWVLKAI